MRSVQPFGPSAPNDVLVESKQRQLGTPRPWPRTHPLCTCRRIGDAISYAYAVHALDHQWARSGRASTRMCFQLLVEGQYRHHHSTLLQTLRQVDDGDVCKGVAYRGHLREAAREIDKVFRSQ